MVTAYIGIGSNLGDRKKYINDAIDLLNSHGLLVVKRVSSIYETMPVGGPPQASYLNGVIKILKWLCVGVGICCNRRLI